MPISSIGSFIQDVETNIFKSCNNLSFQERMPLAIATTVATANFNFWVAAVNSPGNWLSKGYFDTNAYVNYAQIPSWVQAAVQATLWGGSKASTYGQMDPPQVIGVDIISALTSSIGVAAGKTLFNWIPQIQQC